MSAYIPPADAPFIVKAAAQAAYGLHIGGGAMGMVSGAVAFATRKGGRIHRLSGNVFTLSMLVMAGIGAIVAPLIHERVSILAGSVTFYLILSAWLTVKRPPGQIGPYEYAAALVPLAGVALAFLFIHQAQSAPNGELDGQPPQGPYMFALISGFAFLGDAHLLLRKGLSGAARTARHLWRMGVGMFIASGSFFLGQMRLFPAPIRHSILPYLPVLATVLLTVFWLARTWWVGRRRHSPRTAAA